MNANSNSNSNSIAFPLTNSNISCFSSKCFSSLRDNRCGRCGWLECIGPDPETISFCELILKNVGVPSIVFTMGFSKPPRSNSCADIFLLGKHNQNEVEHIIFNQAKWEWYLISGVDTFLFHCWMKITMTFCLPICRSLFRTKSEYWSKLKIEITEQVLWPLNRPSTNCSAHFRARVMVVHCFQNLHAILTTNRPIASSLSYSNVQHNGLISIMFFFLSFFSSICIECGSE